jgi:uncharacterized protein YaiL (DUF2058 family)
MSMSLRDQLLQAGLVSQKQVREAERQQERQTRQQPRKRGPAGGQQAGGKPPSVQQPPVSRPHASAQQPPGGHPHVGGQAAAAQAGPQNAAQPRPPDPTRTAQAAKIARDLALNRQQQEKAHKKALQAQIKQLLDQNALPPVEGGESYNFVDGGKVRHVAVNAATRSGLVRGELVIVRHEARYHLMPASMAGRIRERDPGAIVAAAPTENSPTDAAYEAFSIPDDLIW